MKKIYIILISIFLCSINSITIYAQDESNLFAYSIIGTDNNYIDIVAEPGEDFSFSIRLYNNGTVPKTNEIFISDGYTANNGGTMTMPYEEATRDHAGGWFDFVHDKITLSPGEEQILTVKGTIPDDIKPGNHVAVLYLRSGRIDGATSDANKKGTSFKINHVYSLSSAIVVRVPGDMQYGFEIENYMDKKFIKDKDLVLTFNLQNSGNTYDFLNLFLTITDEEQNILYSTEKKTDIVYPGNSFYVNFAIPPKVYTDALCTVELTVVYDPEKQQTISRNFQLDLSGREISKAKRVIRKEEEALKTYVISDKNIYTLLIGMFLLLILSYTLFSKKNKKTNEELVLKKGDE